MPVDEATELSQVPPEDWDNAIRFIDLHSARHQPVSADVVVQKPVTLSDGRIMNAEYWEYSTEDTRGRGKCDVNTSVLSVSDLEALASSLFESGEIHMITGSSDETLSIRVFLEDSTSAAHKTLDDLGVVIESTGWPHGDAVVNDLLGRCHRSEALQVIDDLIGHVETMGVASRFKADRYARQLFADHQDQPPIDLIDYAYGGGKKLSEKGHKRATLLIELKKIRGAFGVLFNELASVRLNIETTNMEPGGEHVPTPSVDDLKRLDTFQRKAQT